MVTMMILRSDNKTVVVYERPAFIHIRKETEFAAKDIETGQDLYEDIYKLRMYFPCGIVVVKSNKEEKVVEIEKALSGYSLSGEYHVETVYCISLGEDLADNLQPLTKE
jgi:hypothetical protein